MKITVPKCPSCGANLKIDESKEIIKCDHCKQTIIVEELNNNPKNKTNNTSKASNKILNILMFFLLLAGMAYFPYIPMKLFNFDINSFNDTMKIIYNFICDIGFILIIFLIYKNTIIKNFKEYFKKFGQNFETSFKYYLVGLIIMIISNLIITFVFTKASANNEETVRSLIDNYPLYMIFSVSIYAPFIEEIIFRKSIKDSIMSFGNNKFTKYLYIAISGLIFSSLHVVGITTSNWDYIYIIPYLSLGCAFAALYYKTDNIFSTITMHAMHNTITVILYLVAGGIQ